MLRIYGYWATNFLNDIPRAKGTFTNVACNELISNAMPIRALRRKESSGL